jgi:hypothetical protein
VSSSTLLTVDAVINLVLGVALVVFPSGVVSALGVPRAEVAFYPSLLGAVLLGIGVALLVQRIRGSSGLGMAGAMSINLIAGTVLAAWLIFGSLVIPPRGRLLLWALVVLLVGLSAFELAAQARDRGKRSG